MGRGECFLGAHVDDQAVGADPLVHLLRGEALAPRQLRANHAGPCRIDLLHAPEVGRRDRHAAQQRRHPVGLRQLAQRLIEPALKAEGRGFARADRLAAQRARAMCREQLEKIRQMGDPLEDALVELVGEPLLGLRPEVGPTDIADEQKITGEQYPRRVVAPRPVEQRPANMLRRVAGRVQSLEAQASEADLVTATNHRVSVRRRPFRAAEARTMNACLIRQPRLQLHRAADEVGVHVGLEDVGDAQALLACQAHTRLDIARRVDDRATAGGFVTDHVGVDGEARHELTMQEHWAIPFESVSPASGRAASGCGEGGCEERACHAVHPPPASPARASTSSLS